MPETKKKIAKKKTKAVKPKTKKIKSVTTNTDLFKLDEFVIPEKKFINIYDQDPIMQTKSRITWLIVGVIMLVIIYFWFWSLKTSMVKSDDQNNDLQKITLEINSIVQEFKDIVGESKNIINESSNQNNSEKDIEKIKNDVLNQIEINSDSANWPEHSSNLLNLKLKYPTNWSKQEKKDLLTLSSYDLKSTTTPEIFAQINISKFVNDGSAIENLIENKTNYTKSSEQLFIDLLPANRYNLNNLDENSLSYTLLISNPKNIYKIDVYSNNKSIFEISINKILSTIDLL